MIRSLSTYYPRLDKNPEGARFRADPHLEPLDALALYDLLEILEENYGRRSTIITSQLPVASWHEVIGDPTYADAILDRLVHNAHRLNLEGDNMRRLKNQTRPLDGAPERNN